MSYLNIRSVPISEVDKAVLLAYQRWSRTTAAAQ